MSGLARGLLLIKRIKVSVRDFLVSSVNAIQPSEPRVQTSNGPQGRGNEPFSDLLESAANSGRADADARKEPSKRAEPEAPVSRHEARTDALKRDEAAGSAPAAKPSATANGPQHAEDGKPRAVVADGASKQPPETVAKTESSEAENGVQACIENVGKPAVGADASADEASAEDGEAEDTDMLSQHAPEPLPQVTDGQAENTDKTIAAVKVTAADGQLETATEAPQTVADGLPTAGATQNINSDDETATAPVTASKAVTASAPVSAPPATPQQSDAEAATTSGAPVNQPRGAVPLPDQAQTQQASPAGGMATAAAGEASTPFEGDADAQLPQRQSDAQPVQAKPQEAKAAPQAEIAKAVIPSAEATSPKVQPVILPEPVRALAASINPASLQAANMNERNPLPLNAAAIAVEIVSRLRDGMRRFDIRLDPPELGRIDVRLEMDRSGNVTTKLTLDRPETLDLMQRDARGLERALQQAGLKTDTGGLEFSLRSHADHHPAQDHAGREVRRPDMMAAEDGERIEAAIEGYRAAAFARGGVDIRI